jgi:hypothetical protein
MPRHPVKRTPSRPPVAARQLPATIEQAADQPFFSFRYSYSEISVRDGKAHVKSKAARFEDGKLATESFEGELPRTAYDDAVRRAQQHFVDQTELFWRSLSALLPRR